MPKELKLSQENAEIQWDLFLDWYDLDYDEMITEAKKRDEDGPLITVRKAMFKAIRQGRLEIREEQGADQTPTLVFVQNLDRPIQDLASIKYHEVTAATHIASRPGKNVSDEARVFDYLSILAKCDLDTLAKLRGGDARLARFIGYLFLAV